MAKVSASSIEASELDPTACFSYRLRRAARLAAKHYDTALKPVGLRNTQFTLLGALDLLGETSIGDLADELATDATTLNRNLEVLVRQGLIENTLADDARVRKVRLTAAGTRKYAQALPHWQQAQRHLLGTLDAKQWTAMQQQLGAIEGACKDDF